MAITINSPLVGDFFAEQDTHHWLCKANNNIIQYGILDYYKSVNGLLALGLPLSNEVPLDTNGNMRQFYERGCLVYDPGKRYDNPPGSGSVYAAHVYDTGDTNNALGHDPYIDKLLALIQQLQAQAGNQDAATKLAQAKALVAQLSTLVN